MFFFWVHFKILIYSGPGDTFMSPAFQETLLGNELLLNAQGKSCVIECMTDYQKSGTSILFPSDIRIPRTTSIPMPRTTLFDTMMAESAVKVCLLLGNIANAIGQQVTAYPHNDTNNHWQVLPTREIPDSGRGRVVRHNDVIQLLHVNTDTLLLTHDVASPLMPTNQEFTTIPRDQLEERRADTLFQVQINDAHDGEAWRSLSGHFKLSHMPTKVLLWTHAGVLPEWGHGHNEVNGNKNTGDRTTMWFVNEIIADGTGNDFRNRTVQVEPKQIRSMNFFKKFFQLQILMLQHNAGLTSDHPYASSPVEWPFCLSGVSFWTDSATSQQIYMVGNMLGWWICSVALSVFVGIIGADMLARRRGIDPIEDSE